MIIILSTIQARVLLYLSVQIQILWSVWSPESTQILDIYSVVALLALSSLSLLYLSPDPHKKPGTSDPLPSLYTSPTW